MGWLEPFTNGLITGSIHTLIALLFEASKTANLARGEPVTHGALFAATARDLWGWSLIASPASGMVAMAALVVAINVFLPRFLIGRPAITAIMVTLHL